MAADSILAESTNASGSESWRNIIIHKNFSNLMPKSSNFNHNSILYAPKSSNFDVRFMKIYLKIQKRSRDNSSARQGFQQERRGRHKGWRQIFSIKVWVGMVFCIKFSLVLCSRLVFCWKLFRIRLQIWKKQKLQMH